MANSKAISIRVPDDLLEKIDRLAQKKYTSHRGNPNRSLVVLDIIAAHFNTSSDTSSSENDLSVSDDVDIQEFRNLQTLFSTLSDNVVQLKKEMTALSDIVRQTDWKKLLPVQLSTSDALPMSDNVVAASSLDLGNGLTVGQLAARLKETPQIVGSKKKNKPKEFTDWSKEKDPDGYRWEYNNDSKLYYPIKPIA